jgi:hypothetical protein
MTYNWNDMFVCTHFIMKDTRTPTALKGLRYSSGLYTVGLRQFVVQEMR